jgi:hypothetical protein
LTCGDIEAMSISAPQKQRARPQVTRVGNRKPYAPPVHMIPHLVGQSAGADAKSLCDRRRFPQNVGNATAFLLRVRAIRATLR